jgi:hypothetical protein
MKKAKQCQEHSSIDQFECSVDVRCETKLLYVRAINVLEIRSPCVCVCVCVCVCACVLLNAD